MTRAEKFQQSITDLKHALTFEKQALKDSFYYSGIAKSFEVALEYGWKSLRLQVVDSGLEAESPRDAVKLAGRLGLIDDVEQWLNFLKIRNIAVHDYLGIDKSDYLKAAHDLLGALTALERKLKSKE